MALHLLSYSSRPAEIHASPYRGAGNTKREGAAVDSSASYSLPIRVQSASDYEYRIPLQHRDRIFINEPAGRDHVSGWIHMVDERAVIGGRGRRARNGLPQNSSAVLRMRDLFASPEFFPIG